MPTTGPTNAPVAIVTDWPDYRINDALVKMGKLGIDKNSIFTTSLLETPPPPDIDGEPDFDALLSSRKTCPGVGWERVGEHWFSPILLAGAATVRRQLAAECKPRIVIGLGKGPLVVFTGQDKLASWRGSRLTPHSLECPFLPTIHPRTLVKQPDQRFILECDLTRAYNIYTGAQVPRHYNFLIEPTFNQTTGYLLGLIARADAGPIILSGDLETRAGNIACFGIADSPTRAICIPHLVISETNPYYWSLEDEAVIVSLYAQLFSHPNITWVGQNFSYDCQYFHRHWGILPINVRDTMVGHHSLHSNIRKGLDFLSSIYAQDHVYWKDEIKEWDPSIGEKQYWTYNCKDACITYEIWPEILKERERD